MRSGLGKAANRGVLIKCWVVEEEQNIAVLAVRIAAQDSLGRVEPDPPSIDVGRVQRAVVKVCRSHDTSACTCINGHRIYCEHQQKAQESDMRRLGQSIAG